MKKFFVGALFALLVGGIVSAQTEFQPSATSVASVAEEGTDLAVREKINFIGPAITCADNSGATRTDCTTSALPTQSGQVTENKIPYIDEDSGTLFLRDTNFIYDSASSKLNMGTATDARKLAVYNSVAGDQFYGLGVTSGQLEIRTADDGTDDPAIAVSSDGTTSFSRITSADAGARIDFRRASDNEKYWHFDVVGSTATPGFRVFEGVHPSYTTSARFQNGRLGVGPNMNANPPLHLLDLGDALDSRKLAVFQSIAGDNFFGLGVSSGILEIRAADDGDDAAEMIVRANGGGVAIDSEGTYIDRSATLTVNANKDTEAYGSPSVSVNLHSLIQGNGSDTDFRGVSAGYFGASDRPGVGTGTENAGVLYGVQATVKPLEDRNNVPNDDAVAFLGQNDGTGKATDGFYLGSGSGGITGSQWVTQMTLEPAADYGIRLLGEKAASHLEIFDGTGVEANLKMRVYKTGELQLGSNSATEGGEMQLNRASDDTPHWYIDSTGGTASPWFRIFSKHDDTSVIKHWLTFKTSESYVDFGGNKLVNYTSFSGALLRLTTDAAVTVAAGAPGTILDFDTETYDEGGWHSSSDGYFVIPTGVSRIRASYSMLRLTEQAGTLKPRVLINDSYSYAGTSIKKFDTADVDGRLLTGQTAIVSVSAGDTVKVAVEAGTADNDIDANVVTWFQIEAIF